MYLLLCALLFLVEDFDVCYGGYRVYNRAMVDFCAVDCWFMGVVLCDLDELEWFFDVFDDALVVGFGLVWILARVLGERLFGYLFYDAFWVWLVEVGVLFVFYVGSGLLFIGDVWMNDGRALVMARGGAEVIGFKDFMVVY